jgi:hypothetical protein
VKLTELDVVNAFFGFCTPMAGTWPTPLLSLGYQVIGVEAEVITVLDGNDRRLVPDIVCASPILSHSLCVDAKSATVTETQERAYESLTGRTLVTQGLIPPEFDQSSLSNDSLLVTSRDNEPKLHMGLEAINVGLPVVAADESGFDLTRGQLTQPDIHRVFAEGIRLSNAEWPRSFVPFNSRSPIGDAAPIIMRSLLQLVLRQDRFTVVELATLAIRHWDLCGPTEQKSFRKTIRELLWRAEREELSNDVKRTGKEQVWEFVGRKPSSVQYLDAFQDRVSQFVTRLQAGLEFQEGQPLLLSAEVFRDEDE